MYEDDFSTPRAASKSFLRWFIPLALTMTVAGLVLWALGVFTTVATMPVNTAVGVLNRVADPDHALETYRWFHDTYQSIKAKQGQIRLAKQALAASADDRKEARRVELLGLQEGCQSLVGEYNSKATRADTVIFQHPERFLPGNWPGERNPLPSEIDLTACD
ncbi:MAG: hypothetical protein RLZZ324_1095 [Candidatus Parcubacteria bacterium]|jgi:hypothetical protein